MTRIALLLVLAFGCGVSHATAPSAPVSMPVASAEPAQQSSPDAGAAPSALARAAVPVAVERADAAEPAAVDAGAPAPAEHPDASAPLTSSDAGAARADAGSQHEPDAGAQPAPDAGASLPLCSGAIAAVQCPTCNTQHQHVCSYREGFECCGSGEPTDVPSCRCEGGAP